MGNETVLDQNHQLAGFARHFTNFCTPEICRCCLFGNIVESEIRRDPHDVLDHGLRRSNSISFIVLLVRRQRPTQRNHCVVVLSRSPLQHSGEVLHRGRVGEASSRIVVCVPSEQCIGPARLDQGFVHIAKLQIIHHAVVVDHRPFQRGRVIIQYVVAHDERCDVLRDTLGITLFCQAIGFLQRRVALLETA